MDTKRKPGDERGKPLPPPDGVSHHRRLLSQTFAVEKKNNVSNLFRLESFLPEDVRDVLGQCLGVRRSV